MDFSFEAKEQRWYLSPLTLGDLAALKTWVGFLSWENLQRVKDRIDPDVFAVQSSRLLLECANKRVTEKSQEYTDAMDTTEGVVQLVYLMLRKNHPKLTVTDVMDLLTTRNLPEVMALVFAVSNMGRDQKDPFPKTKKTKRSTSDNSIKLPLKTELPPTP